MWSWTQMMSVTVRKATCIQDYSKILLDKTFIARQLEYIMQPCALLQPCTQLVYCSGVFSASVPRTTQFVGNAIIVREKKRKKFAR